MKANRILSFTLSTFNIVWGKPRRGGAPASWLGGPPTANLAPTIYTSYNVASSSIRTSTRTLCVLHQSTWLSTQPFTPTRRVKCMCVVPKTVPSSGWIVPACNAWAIANWGVVSNGGWIKGKKPATSWGWFLNSHFFMDLAQHFFPTTNVATLALGSRVRQGLTKLRAKKEAWESCHMLLGKQESVRE